MLLQLQLNMQCTYHYHVVYSDDDDDEWLLNRIWDCDQQSWYKSVLILQHRMGMLDEREIMKSIQITCLLAIKSFSLELQKERKMSFVISRELVEMKYKLAMLNKSEII